MVSVELLKNAHRVTVVHDCDSLCIVRHSRVQHNLSFFTIGSFHLLGSAYGYPLHLT